MNIKDLWDDTFVNNKLNELYILEDKKDISIKEQLLIEDSIDTYTEILRILSNHLYKHNEMFDDDNLDHDIRTNLDLLQHYEKGVNENYIKRDKIKELINKYIKLKQKKQHKLNRINYSNQHKLNISKNMYRNFNIDLFNSIKEIENRNPSLFLFTNNYNRYGQCFFDVYNKIPYLLVENNNTIEDIYNITHELAHGIDYINNPDLGGDYIFIQDSPSFLMEMILTNSCIGSDLENESKKVSTNLFNIILDISEIVDIQIKTIEYIEKEKYISNNDLISMFPNISIDTIERVLSTNYSDNVRNLYSYVVASNLFEQYCYDKKEGLKNINKLFFRNNENNITNILHKTDMDFDNLEANKIKEKQKKILL